MSENPTNDRTTADGSPAPESAPASIPASPAPVGTTSTPAGPNPAPGGSDNPIGAGPANPGAANAGPTDWWARPSGALSSGSGSAAQPGPYASSGFAAPAGGHQQTSVLPGYVRPNYGQYPVGGADPRLGGGNGPGGPYGSPGHPDQYGPGGPQRSTGKAKKTAAFGTAIVLGLAAAFGAGYLGSEVNSSSNNAAGVDNSLTRSPVAPEISAKIPEAGAVQQVADQVLPSVVSVVAAGNNGAGEGSGVILSADGTILTNNHVVQGATQISVRFNDGSRADAEIVGTDAIDDLAVIKAKDVSNLTPATLGSSADLAVGEQVVAIGSPLGLSSTVTTGIVSSLNRPVRTSDSEQQPQQPQNPWGQQDPGQTESSTGAADTVLNAIQTDAAINPGNSGGALVDLNGKVIGINSAIASTATTGSQAGNIGVGFAIPIDQAKRIAEEIIDKGYATHAVLGATVGDASENGITASGAVLAGIVDGGAAQAAGLQKGDQITRIGSQLIESADALVATIRSQVPGGKVEFTYVRDGKTATVAVTLGSAKSE